MVLHGGYWWFSFWLIDSWEIEKCFTKIEVIPTNREKIKKLQQLPQWRSQNQKTEPKVGYLSWSSPMIKQKLATKSWAKRAAQISPHMAITGSYPNYWSTIPIWQLLPRRCCIVLSISIVLAQGISGTAIIVLKVTASKRKRLGLPPAMLQSPQGGAPKRRRSWIKITGVTTSHGQLP